MKLDIILRVGAKLVLPFIFMFALYVQFHGDYGPGGGFQAGVIAAGSIILYAIIFGVKAAKVVAPQEFVEFMVPLGVLVYAGTGVVGMMLGYNFLDYTGFSHEFLHAHEWGILIVEIGVFITVCGTMSAMLYAFVDRGR